MSSRRGNFTENRVRDDWAALGWTAMCGRCSRGPADVLAVKAGEQPRLIQVKGDQGSPYANFRPEDRRVLVEEALNAGGIALLAWWPKGVKRADGWPRYIPWTDWPAPRTNGSKKRNEIRSGLL